MKHVFNEHFEICFILFDTIGPSRFAEIDWHGRVGDTGTPSLNASMIDVGILSWISPARVEK